MAMEKVQALVLRSTDWSESSRIATLFTRELGKVRALAKGGRRLRSAFESALDLLTHCSIVLLRKSSGSLDLLTEAQVIQCFPGLRSNLPALYAAYYLAELLEKGAQDHDPHPALFDEAVATLQDLGSESTSQEDAGLRIMRFEATWLVELGLAPTLEHCAGCAGPVTEEGLIFSSAAGGVVCSSCRSEVLDRRPLSPAAWSALRQMITGAEGEQIHWTAALSAELRRVLGHHVTWVLGRPPRLLAYLQPGRGAPG